MKFFSEVRNLAAKHGRVCVQASRALEATSKQDGQGRQSTRWSRPTVKVGSGNPLLLRLAMVGPAGAAARCPLLRGACARAGGATKERTGVVRGATAHRSVRISGHISHGVANGTIMPKKKKCALLEYSGCSKIHPPPTSVFSLILAFQLAARRKAPVPM